MSRFVVVVLVLLGVVTTLRAQSPHLVYAVAVKDDDRKSYHFSLEITHPPSEEMVLEIPLWAPGAYRPMTVGARNGPLAHKQLKDFRAVNGAGRKLSIKADGERRWKAQIVHLNPASGRWISDQSHLQRHVNAAIAYNVWQYYEATADREFVSHYGAEMILEIARFWASIATYNDALGRYEIHGVMGPDEYHDGYPDT